MYFLFNLFIIDFSLKCFTVELMWMELNKKENIICFTSYVEKNCKYKKQNEKITKL